MHEAAQERKQGAPRRFSTVDFKKPSANLHRLSKYIFLISLLLSVAVTAIILTWTMRVERAEQAVPMAAVVMMVEHIPETVHRVETPAPPAPFTPSAAPLPVDDILPDDVTIEDTELVLDTPPVLPPAIVLPGAGDDEALEEVYEYYAVEEAPERIESVVPVYPQLAVRAGIGGTVTLKALVNTEGMVDSVAVMDGPDVLVDSAKDAALATTFTPARHLDRPVACWVILTFRFTLPH